MVEPVAEELAREQREISVAEFFEKNRHLLGFDSRVKAVLTCVKEAVDNSLDACEDLLYRLRRRREELLKKKAELERKLGIGKRGKERILKRLEKLEEKIKQVEEEIESSLPEIRVEIRDLGEGSYKIAVLDNGPGIVPEQVPRCFGKLLYGSRFHKLKQSRGQQGVGISAGVLYSQLTKGKPVRVISKIAKDKPAYCFEVMIDIIRNEPDVVSKRVVEGFPFDHGTQVELEVEGTYLGKGSRSVIEYLRRTSVINPTARITFVDPQGQKFVFPRTSRVPPIEPLEIKPHPHGIEVGILLRMLKATIKRTLLSFIITEFCRVGSTSAKQIIRNAGLAPDRDPKGISREEAERLAKAMQGAKLMRPPTDCLSPIGEKELVRSLEIEYKPEFATAITREPTVYRGMPFQVEAAIAYGGEIPAFKEARVVRYADKVPLIYQSGSCAITQAARKVDWRRYGVEKVSSGLPVGSFVIIGHVLSVWVPFTSESKSAIASYLVITRELRLAFQECARRLKLHLARKYKRVRRIRRMKTFLRYSGEVATSLSKLTGKKKEEVSSYIQDLIREKYGEEIEGWGEEAG
jgi:DNA topoisomerase-6 subunit B